MALIPCENLSLEVFDNGEESITVNETEREREREREREDKREFLKMSENYYTSLIQYITKSCYL